MKNATNQFPAGFTVIHLVIALLGGFGSAALHAQTTATWNGTTGNWEDATRWSTDPAFPANGSPPGVTYDAVIAAGEARLNTNITLDKLLLQGGTLVFQQGNPLLLNTGFDWSGGIVRGSPNVGIEIGPMGLSAWSGMLELRETLIKNSGQLTIADGTEVAFYAAFDSDQGLRNLAGGTVTLQGGGSWLSDWFGEGPVPDGFNNLGTLIKNGAGTFAVGALSPGFTPAAPFQNFGAVQVNAGELRINTPVEPSSGSWTVADGAKLTFNNGVNATAGSSFTGVGDFEFNGSSTISGTYGVNGMTTVNGSVNFNAAGPVSLHSVIVGPSGNLRGSAPISVTDSLVWRGTILADAANQLFTLASGATGSTVFNSNFTLDRRVFLNEGDFTWLGGTTAGDSVFRFFQNAVFSNLVVGTFTAEGNGTGGIASFGGSTSGTFINAGTFEKAGTGTTTRLNWNFQNPGLVDVQSGRLEIAALTTPGGMFEVANGGQLFLQRNVAADLFSGTYSVASGGLIEFGRGHVDSTAGFSTGFGTVAFTGDGRISRDMLPASLVRFASTTRVTPPSGTLTIADAELVNGGLIGLLSPDRLRISNSLNWTGGGVSTPSGFIGFTGGTLELAAGSTTALTGLGTVSSSTLQVDGALNVAPGGTLQISASGVVQNNTALTFGNGGILLMTPSTSAAQDARLVGGSLMTEGTGVIRVGPSRLVSGGRSYATLDNVSAMGTLDLFAAASVVRLVNGATFQGNVNYTATGAASFTAFEMHQNGVLQNILFEDVTANKSAQAVLAVIGNRTVTIGSGTELRNIRNVLGDYFVSGLIDNTGNSTIINEGRVVSDVPGLFTFFAAIDTLENRGILEARNGGRISVDREFSQTAGKILLADGSTFQMTTPTYRPSTRTVTMTGGSLEGQGVFNGNLVLNGGMIAPGSSAGLLTMTNGAVTILSGTLSFELGGATRGTLHDAITAHGLFDLGALGAELELGFIEGFENSVLGGDTFNLITATTLSGTFANVANGGRLSTVDELGSFQVNYGTGSAFDENSVILSHFVAVPEPGTWALIGLGCVLLLGAARSGRRR